MASQNRARSSCHWKRPPILRGWRPLPRRKFERDPLLLEDRETSLEGDLVSCQRDARERIDLGLPTWIYSIFHVSVYWHESKGANDYSPGNVGFLPERPNCWGHDQLYSIRRMIMPASVSFALAQASDEDPVRSSNRIEMRKFGYWLG